MPIVIAVIAHDRSRAALKVRAMRIGPVIAIASSIAVITVPIVRAALVRLALMLKLVLVLDIRVSLLMGSVELPVQALMLPRRQFFFVLLFVDRTELTVSRGMLAIQLSMIFVVHRLGHRGH